MSVEVFDENFVLGDKGYVVDDPATLADLGVPTAVQVDVIVHVSGYVVAVVEFPEYKDYYGTGKTVADLGNYLSLADLSAFILQKPATR